MPAPILIFAIGNESRGDDAIAPLLMRRLAASPPTDGLAGRCELLEDFQLQIEHATDLVGRELVLFIDAGMDSGEPFTFSHAAPANSRTVFSHALTPADVLATYRQVFQQEPPPAFVLVIRGERFELGAQLSPEAGRRMELALGFVGKLIQEADPSSWQNRCRDASDPGKARFSSCGALSGKVPGG